MVKKYIPNKGDIIFVDFNPTKGHEQSGYRPAIVISNIIFNKHTGMAIICPITSNEKEFPTHYNLCDTKKIKGSVLCEYVRSIDFNVRKIKFIEKISDIELINIIDLFNACIE